MKYAMSEDFESDRYTQYSDIPLLMTPSDVMRTIPLSRGNIYRLLSSKQFSVMRIKGRLLVRKDELFKWLKRSERKWQ